MRGSAVVHKGRLFIGIGLVGGCLLTVMMGEPRVFAVTASTTIGATVCVASSSITLDVPVSDSVVTDPNVALDGTINQATQIEVYIDGVLDHVIPLNIGQASYMGSVQLEPGTHTIKVVAINTCPGTDGSASSVVTYTPPSPEVVSPTGGGTQTTVNNGGSKTDGVVVSAGGDQLSVSAPQLPEVATEKFKLFLGWLNINIGDSMKGNALSLWRAIVIAIGLYLLVIGVTVKVIKKVAKIPAIVTLVPFLAHDQKRRRRWVSWSVRVLGLLLILAMLFL